MSGMAEKLRRKESRKSETPPARDAAVVRACVLAEGAKRHSKRCLPVVVVLLYRWSVLRTTFHEAFVRWCKNQTETAF